MMRMPWQLVVAIFWSGMFVEAAIGNILGRVSSQNGLLGDVAMISFLVFCSKVRWKVSR
jgi:hypothetical protein